MVRVVAIGAVQEEPDLPERVGQQLRRAPGDQRLRPSRSARSVSARVRSGRISASTPAYAAGSSASSIVLRLFSRMRTAPSGPYRAGRPGRTIRRQADVEVGRHEPRDVLGHRRPHRDQQRVAGVAEPPAGQHLEVVDHRADGPIPFGGREQEGVGRQEVEVRRREPPPREVEQDRSLVADRLFAERPGRRVWNDDGVLDEGAAGEPPRDRVPERLRPAIELARGGGVAAPRAMDQVRRDGPPVRAAPGRGSGRRCRGPLIVCDGAVVEDVVDLGRDVAGGLSRAPSAASGARCWRRSAGRSCTPSARRPRCAPGTGCRGRGRRPENRRAAASQRSAGAGWAAGWRPREAPGRGRL